MRKLVNAIESGIPGKHQQQELSSETIATIAPAWHDLNPICQQVSPN